MNLGIFALAASLILVGCATQAPKFDKQPTGLLTHESSWVTEHASASTGLADSLLALFDDEVLTELVLLSQQNNLSLLQQKSATSALSVSVIQAAAAQSPELLLTQNSSRQDNGTSLTEAHRVTLDAQWELDLWGGMQAQSNSEMASFNASKLNYQWMQASIAAQTMQAYINAVTQAQQLHLSEEKMHSFDTTLNVVTANFKAGTADLDDLTEARQNLASAEIGRIESQLSNRNSIRTLQVLTGAYPDGLDLVARQLPALMHAPDAKIPAAVLAQRPDIQSAWLTVQSASADILVAEAAKLPSIVLTAQLGSTSDALRNILSGDAIWSLASSIGYTLFDQGALNAVVAAKRSLAQKSYYAYLETVITALSEVETALDTEQSYLQLERSQREVIKQAHLLLGNAEQDYRSGSAEMTDWLSYQRSYFNEQSALIETVNQRLQNRVSLGLSLGLGI